MVKVCEYCSHVDVDELKTAVGAENVEVGCLGECAKYETESYGYVGEEMVVQSSSSQWISKVLEISK